MAFSLAFCYFCACRTLLGSFVFVALSVVYTYRSVDQVKIDRDDDIYLAVIIFIDFLASPHLEDYRAIIYF